MLSLPWDIQETIVRYSLCVGDIVLLKPYRNNENRSTTLSLASTCHEYWQLIPFYYVHNDFEVTNINYARKACYDLEHRLKYIQNVTLPPGLDFPASEHMLRRLPNIHCITFETRRIDTWASITLNLKTFLDASKRQRSIGKVGWRHLGRTPRTSEEETHWRGKLDRLKAIVDRELSDDEDMHDLLEEIITDNPPGYQIEPYHIMWMAVLTISCGLENKQAGRRLLLSRHYVEVIECLIGTRLVMRYILLNKAEREAMEDIEDARIGVHR